MEPAEIDPVKYGVLWQRVTEMDKKIDKMERQVEELLALANRSKGGFWMGMTIASLFGNIVTCKVVEVQYGDICTEEDIVRI